jgi:hypothetical protein
LTRRTIRPNSRCGARQRAAVEWGRGSAGTSRRRVVQLESGEAGLCS